MAGGFLAAPLAVMAQSAGQRPRIGYLASGGPPRHSTDVFIGRLRELGYEPGRNLEFEFRSLADARNAEQLRELAAGLVSLSVDILVAAGPPAAFFCLGGGTLQPASRATLGRASLGCAGR